MPEIHSNVQPLSSIRKGEEGTVVELNTADRNILKKLLSMGVVPGMPVRAVQTYPSYVFQTGYTQVAVDREIASIILVQA